MAIHSSRITIDDAEMSITDSTPAKHEWLVCMERFARSIGPFWTEMLERSKTALGEEDGKAERLAIEAIENDVTVALIDDGVMMVDEYWNGRVLVGKTLDYQEGGEVGQPYASNRGHGTEMAKLILRVCPMAKIYPIRLKSAPAQDGKGTIDLQSAAAAINIAREQNASIISMPWFSTIPTNPGKEYQDAEKLFTEAITHASEEKRIMICSSPDKGKTKTRGYPSAAEDINILRIGAASWAARTYEWTEDYADYILPGVGVDKVAPNDRMASPGEITGSTVAAALGAGLAATIVYCFKTAALATKIAWAQGGSRGLVPSTQFSEEHVRKIAEHLNMEFAFANIGHINQSRFFQVWDLFKPVCLVLENPGKSQKEKLESIITLCVILYDWRAGLEFAN